MKRYGRFTEKQLKNRDKRRAPHWLWKWTADAHYEYKEKKKHGSFPDLVPEMQIWQEREQANVEKRPSHLSQIT